MKLLYIQHGLGFGGATKSLLVMLNKLKSEHEIHVVSLPVNSRYRILIEEFNKIGYFREMNLGSVASYAYGTDTIKRFKKTIRNSPSELIDYINYNNIDIVHINTSLFSHLLEPIKTKTSARIVVHIREMIPNGFEHPIDKYIIDNTEKFSDIIIFISDNESRFFHPNNRNITLPNPHDFEETDLFLKNEKQNEYPITIGMCANFIKYKGHIDFIRAARIVNQKYNNSQNINFQIIGYPHKTFKLRDIIKSVLKYGYKIKFDKEVKRLGLYNLTIIPFTLNIYQEISKIDIYVRPDITGHPWGRDIIEAMALKKPVIATGTSEFYVENGSVGYLVPPNDSNILAERIMELIESKEKRIQFGERGYSKIKKMCDLNLYSKKLLSIYVGLKNG